MIDPHVHCRDGNQGHKDNIPHALSVAYDAGITAIFDMPNTDPPILTAEVVEKRLKIAEKANIKVFYGIHVGLTTDPNQITDAVNCYSSLFSHVVGFKMYAGHSVGNLGIVSEKGQKFVYDTLTKEGYEGVLVVHCEKEALLSQWDPSNPVSHSYARPPEAETESIKDQIRFANDAGFPGKLHITHVSTPQSVDLIRDAAAETKLKLSCDVTPHHCLLNTELIRTLPPEVALLFKVNPPLRERSYSEKMLEYLKAGKIDCIGTDHAPHTLSEKTGPPFMSGLPGLHFVPYFLEYLKEKGFSEDQLLDLTHINVSSIYKINAPVLKPRSDSNLWSEYETDVYHLVEPWASKRG